MAWVATDNFDSYTAGNPLNGDNGGSGWSTAWAVTIGGTGSITTQTAPAGGQGGIAMDTTASSGGSSVAARTFAAVTAGMVHFAINPSQTNTSSEQDGFYFFQGATNFLILRMGIGTSQFQAYNSDTTNYEDSGAITANAWNTIDLRWGGTVTTNKYNISVNGGAYSGDKGFNGTMSGGIDQFQVNWGGSQITSVYVDDIRPISATTTNSGMFFRATR